MKILTIYSNGTLGVVNNTDLDNLIRKNEILAFHRSDEWVRIGLDEMRDPDRSPELSWKNRKVLNRGG